LPFRVQIGNAVGIKTKNEPANQATGPEHFIVIEQRLKEVQLSVHSRFSILILRCSNRRQGGVLQQNCRISSTDDFS
jgi:hypothetical protein